MTSYYQIQTYIKENACTYTCVFICYMRICMDQGIFAGVVGGPSPTGRKEPWQILRPQLILQWGPNVYFKETIIFPESNRGGGSKMTGGPTFSKVMGPNCFFFYRTCCSPGGSGLPVPPLDSRIAYVHVSMFVAF